MKCLKTEEYVARISTLRDTISLHDELKRYVSGGLGPNSRTLFDRVIRACHQRLGGDTPEPNHLERLVELVELAVCSYGLGAQSSGQSSPFYLEKIIFHILQKLVTLRAHGASSRLGDLLYYQLQKSASETEDYHVLVRNCFAVLWNSLLPRGSQAAKGSPLLPRDRLRWQMGALRFRLLDGGRFPTSAPGPSKTPQFVEEALGEFERACESMTDDDIAFVTSEVQTCLLAPPVTQTGGGDCVSNSAFWALRCEVLLKLCKLLCKAQFWAEATKLVDGAQEGVRGLAGAPCPALEITAWAVELHRSISYSRNWECGRAFTDCARLLRGLQVSGGDMEVHALLETCQLIVWATEAGDGRGMDGVTLLAWFSFLEEHQELLLRQLKGSFSQHLQSSLCYSLYQGFISTQDSLKDSQLQVGDCLDRVLLYCRATAGQMMVELRKQPSETFLLKAVCALNSVVYELFNRKQYAEALGLAEIVCQELCKDCPASLPADRVNRCFMLVVQCSRRSGRLEQALDWVVRWIQVLGAVVLDHLPEPVLLWVKTKADAARAGEEDTRLRTLRDGFGASPPGEEVLLRLLEEELRVYKEQPGDTAQERYNTLCDLLDLCSEDTTHTLRRATYLCEMAQVVCYQDFSQQTDCLAVDFTHEAISLLEAEPETPENADRLKDEMAHASLWLYICTLEAKLQEAVDTEQRLRAAQEERKGGLNLEPFPTNDLDYEEKNKLQDSQLVYEGLRCNLSAHNKLTEPLDRCLSVWGALLKEGDIPAVRNPRQTAGSITHMAALYTLMGKPLQALQSYQLAAGLFRCLDDTQSVASTVCHSVRLLLDLGCPELAQMQLEEAERSLTADQSSEGASVISMTTMLLRAQLCYSTGEVEQGVCAVCDVLKETASRHSKSWYLLRARALQIGSAYLSLDTHTLPAHLRQCITQQGLKTPDTAQYEGLKLLCSLVMMLLGNGLYGTPGPNSDTRFIDQGDNVVFKWLLLGEVLVCSERMVCVRSSCGALHEAKVQCLEALKLATKLQTLSHSAELLVLKAELELLKGGTETSVLDLEQVRDLLESCSDFSGLEQRETEVKIKPRKGRPVDTPVPSSSGEAVEQEEDLSGIVKSCSLGRETVEGVAEWAGQGSSPPLKPKRQRLLSSLFHGARCACACCTEPSLARVSVCWALVRAHLDLDRNQSRQLRQAALQRCRSLTASLGAKLASLLTAKPPRTPRPPRLLWPEVGRAYLGLAEALLEGWGAQEKASAVWEVLQVGLRAMDPKKGLCAELGPLRAALLGVKAVSGCLFLASEKGVRAEELFSDCWGWKLPLGAKAKAEHPHRAKSPLLGPVLLTQTPQHSRKNSSNSKDSKKTKELSGASVKKSARDSAPKISTMAPSNGTKYTTAFKTPRAVRTPRPTSSSLVSAGGDVSAFDFPSVGPDPLVITTPVQKSKASTSARRGAPRSKAVPKVGFQVFEEPSSPPQEKLAAVPAAPKRTNRSRFKIDFSDGSDSEEAPPAVADKNKRSVSSTSSKTPRVPKPALSETSGPSCLDPSKRTGRGKRTTALPAAGCPSSEDEGVAPQQTRSRRGRTRKSQPSEAQGEEPERMRTIREDEDVVNLDISLEELPQSDTESQDTGSAANVEADFEVLRRDLGADFRRDCVNELRRVGSGGGAPHTPIPHSATGPADLSLEVVQSLLRSSWLLLHHFPPPALYPHLCSLLALSTGHTDAVATAMLHAQSLGVSTRHHMTRHLASRLRKLKKASSDLAKGLSSLSLEDSALAGGEQHRLAVLEQIFSFPVQTDSQFPHTHSQEFTQQLRDLPAGVTVCLLSVVAVCPGEIGNTILLSKLERDSAPITIRIPTVHQECSVRTLLEEMEGVLKGQKEVSGVAEKAQWWEGRKALDTRMQRLLEQMEEMLGVWRALLLPLTSDPELSVQLNALQHTLSGTRITQDMLKVVLSASPLLSHSDLQSLAEGAEDVEVGFLQLLQEGVSALKGRAEPQGHTVLVLDKYMQRLPWENISCLKPRSVTRMPSLQAVLGHSHLQQCDGSSVLARGVDPQEVYYVLNPDGNLPDTEQRFRDWFTGEQTWQGVNGTAPDPDKLQEAVTTKDLYIYVGHGAGARFLDAQRVLKGQVRAAVLLFGCSSAALSAPGSLEGTGIILSYLTGGCPLVLGNLWDVTDRDLDRFTSTLLRSWLSAGPGSSLLQHLAQSRDSTRLKYMIGAAPIVYGLPVHLR